MFIDNNILNTKFLAFAPLTIGKSSNRHELLKIKNHNLFAKISRSTKNERKNNAKRRKKIYDIFIEPKIINQPSPSGRLRA